jgi:hypothetical protein
MIKIYIASQYSDAGKIADEPTLFANVYQQMVAFDELVKIGYCPMAPLLSHYQHRYFPLPWRKWLQMDLEWIKVCDVLLRLPGVSNGADQEVAHAESLGIPVVRSIDEAHKLFMEKFAQEQSIA